MTTLFVHPSAQALGIAEHPHFNNAMVVLILINTLLLSMEYDGMDAKYANVLQIGNLICTVAFTVELAVKMMAYEWSKLFKVGLLRGFALREK